jgi:endonuclease/exonuclease/phosphatase family metal-dependent hydrolase
MRIALPLILVLVLSALLVHGQEARPTPDKDAWWAMFWNVANLFDDVDDPKTEGRDKSDPKELAERLRRIRSVVGRVNWGSGPDLLVLAEVESADLIRSIVGDGYEVVFDRGKNSRGLNVGMATRLPVVSSEYLDPKTTGRTMLHAVLKVEKQKLHVYGLHLKSKFNTATETEATRTDEELRSQEAEFLRAHVSRILKSDPNAEILIMGDFNENYRDSLFRRELLAKEFKRGDELPSLKDRDRRLLNLGAALEQSFPGGGTAYYHPHWSIIDNFLISEALALPGGLQTTAKEAHIAVSFDLLNNYGTPAHFNPRYPTCVSDHLPILLRLRRSP